MLNLRNRLRSLHWAFYRFLPVRYWRAAQFRIQKQLNQGKLQGTQIVRHYWSQYLDKHRQDIQGRGLEIGTTATIREYGETRLKQADAIDISAYSPEINIVADLSRADNIPSDTYDCFVNQFTMHVIYDVEAALYHSIRLLKPGGVALINFSCVDYYFPEGLDMGTGSKDAPPLFLYHWFTPISVENLLRRNGLTDADYQLTIKGNLFARMAYQMNMPAEELTRDELECDDAHYPLLLCLRVVKPTTWEVEPPVYREPWYPNSKGAQWDSTYGERV